MNILFKKGHRYKGRRSWIKRIPILGLSLFFLLSGCTESPPSQDQDSQELQINYTVTEINFSSLPEGIYEYHEVYHNQISVIGLKDCENYFSSTDLYLLDLENGELEKIEEIDKEEETNRIWNFVRLDKQTYLYTEVAYPSLSDHAFMQYNIYRQKGEDRQRITGGFVSSIYELPELVVMEDSLVFDTISYSFSHEEENGQYDFEIWKVNGENQELLLREEGNYSDYRPDETTEYLSSSLSLVNESELCFTTADATNSYLNRIQNGQCLKQKSTKDLINAIPLGNQWLVTEGKRESMNPEHFTTYLLDDQGLRNDLPSPVHLETYCVLNHTIVGYKNQEIVLIQGQNQEIEIIYIPEIKDSFVFRKINDHAFLILDFKNKMIRVDIEEGSGKAE